MNFLKDTRFVAIVSIAILVFAFLIWKSVKPATVEEKSAE